MKTKIFMTIMEKVIDIIINNSIETIAKKDSNNLRKEYLKTKNVIIDGLLSENKEESYYESLELLLENTNIVDIILMLSYNMNLISLEERKRIISSRIDDFFATKQLDYISIEIIKGKLIKQTQYYFDNINKLDGESRKIVNHILLNIANKAEEQKQLIESLKCDLKDITTLIENMQTQMEDSIDFKYINSVVGQSLENLNVRFSKGFNVDVKLSEWLNKFCNTDFNKEDLYNCLNKLKRIVEKNTIVNNQSLLAHIDVLINKLVNNQQFEYSLLKKEIEEFAEHTNQAILEKYKDYKRGTSQSSEYYYLAELDELNDVLQKFREAMSSSFLIITGEAGVGKSHSIAKFVNDYYYTKELPCIFLLGQHLNEFVNPIEMIEKALHLSQPLQQFLKALDYYAVNNNIEIPFIVEGINEGLYSEVWKEYFPGIIKVFSEYKKIKLIMSVRNTYINRCLPEGFKENKELLCIEHKGLEDNTHEVLIMFFEHYEIRRCEIFSVNSIFL